MGKPTGFLEYTRQDCREIPPEDRIRNFKEFKKPLNVEEQREQAARCMDCGVPFCQSGMMFGNAVSGCPLNNLIPEWNDYLYQGNWQQAYLRLRKTNNFPEFTGRVCPSPCEKACVCNLNGDPVTSHNNELSIIEHAFENGYVQPLIPKVRTGKKVAIVGSGPSGLACADQLNHRGHDVTVFERFDRIGGLLMYGIPNMKLDKKIIRRRLDLMEEEGVKFVTNADVGNGYDAGQLVKDFDAVVLCCGASNPRDLNCPGRDADGIYFAVDFLRANTKSLLDSNLKDGNYISAEGKNVIIVGGGDTGNDCVGTCIRHGCESVIQFEMMDEPPKERTESNPWPQWPNVLKVDYGQEEAIYLQGQDPRIYDTTIKEFLKDENGKLRGVTALNLSWEGGKMKEHDTYEVDCDMVLIAAGFLGCQNYVSDAFGVELTPRTVVDTNDFATSVPGVFAAGDMRRGQSLVVWGISEGRGCAKAVDRYLMGYTNLP
ncbi:MAG: glutamate synthase subunit beta [Oscillospiraceae bacterium]|nr:glutamate synthase subunit beta [Oscillospiraceae bacterium]